MIKLADHLRELFGDLLAPDGTLVRDNFAAWFGGSKVTDANGKPLVMYHGTDKNFTAFNTTPGSRSTFFTNSEELATSYAEEKAKRSGNTPVVVPVYLQISNPMIIDANGASWDDIAVGGIENNNRATRDLEKRGVARITTNRAAEIAEKHGFDGVIIKNVLDGHGYSKDAPRSSVYITFRPEQIKSAIGNSGSFNITDPDMTDRKSILMARAMRAKSFIESVEKTVLKQRIDHKL